MIVAETDPVAAKLGQKFLRGCKVAEWKELPNDRWAPKAWHVDEADVNRAERDDTSIVSDLATCWKLGGGYLRTCEVASWEDGRPAAWVVPNFVLAMDESRFEKHVVYRGDLSAVRKLGKVFLDACEAVFDDEDEESSKPIGRRVPAWILEAKGVKPAPRARAGKTIANMSEARRSKDRASCPEKVIAEEHLDDALKMISPEQDSYDAFVTVCSYLAMQSDRGRFWLPRKRVADELAIDEEMVAWHLKEMQDEALIAYVEKAGLMKVFAFLRDDPKAVDALPAILDGAEAYPVAGTENFQKAVTIAYHLSRLTEDRTFSFPRCVADILGVAQLTVTGFLDRMISKGLATCEDATYKWGPRGVVYRFVGEDLDRPEAEPKKTQSGRSMLKSRPRRGSKDREDATIVPFTPQAF